MANRDNELQQAIDMVKAAIRAENEAKATTEFHMNLLRTNFPEVKDYLAVSTKETAAEDLPLPAETSVDGLTKELKSLMKSQAPLEDIKAKSAELQAAVDG